MALSLEGVSVGEVLEDLQATLSPLARTGHVALEVVAPATPVNIHVDRTRLRQVLLNLGSNAIKYNVDGGTVRIATEIHEGRLRIVVADTGRGIPAAKQADVFQPFNRLGAETGSIPGTGIGLTISKRLTEAMGGFIGFRSEIGRAHV